MHPIKWSLTTMFNFGKTMIMRNSFILCALFFIPNFLFAGVVSTDGNDLEVRFGHVCAVCCVLCVVCIVYKFTIVFILPKLTSG